VRVKQVCLVHGSVEVVEVPAPTCESRGVLIRTACSLISTGTELSLVGSSGHGLIGRAIANPHMARKAWRTMNDIGVRRTVDLVRARERSLVALGYSAAGEIIEVGSKVQKFRVGDRVACAGAGDANHAEFNFVPQNLVALMPPDLDYQSGSFATLGAIALHGVRRLGPSLGERVVVVGLGLIGQLAAQLLTLSGCQVLGIDPLRSRLDLAARLGVAATARADDPDLRRAVSEWTDGTGADAIFVSANSSDTSLVNRSLDLCRKKGRVILVGDVPIRMNRDKLYRKEIDFLISCSYGPGRYDPRYERQGIDYPLSYVRWTEGRNLGEVLRLIAAGKLRVRELIGPVRPLADAAAAYRDLRGPDPAIAALLDFGRPGQRAAAPDRAIRTAASRPVASGRIVLGVIGAGSFFRSVHLPNINRHPGFQIKWISTRTGPSGAQLAKSEGIPMATTDAREILDDPEVAAVMIATRHDLHARLAIETLRAGKHVFVEKPLGLSVAECRAVTQTVGSSGALLTVGFNRRLAPLAVQAKAAFASTREPKTITYRVNAGALAADHWLLGPEGGGRLFGEGVHFFDFVRWFVDAQPLRVHAEALSRVESGVDRDNISLSLAFADGSVATIVYTTQGAPSLPKERVEIFAAGQAIVIDDFISMEQHGTSAKTGRKQRLRRIDKGHEALLDNFFAAISGRAPLAVAAEDGYWATWCAEQAACSLRAGQPARI
jgi:predicted dehydrogenase/threonine dehydrogenase-like Zn-dependent dehydrogenase